MGCVCVDGRDVTCGGRVTACGVCVLEKNSQAQSGQERRRSKILGQFEYSSFPLKILFSEDPVPSVGPRVGPQ